MLAKWRAVLRTLFAGWEERPRPTHGSRRARGLPSDSESASLRGPRARSRRARLARGGSTQDRHPRVQAHVLQRRLFGDAPAGSWPSGDDFDAALRERFGLELGADEPDCERMSAPEQGQWH